MSEEMWKAYAKGISSGMEEGGVNIPYALLRHYRKWKLSDTEVMLLIHLSGFKQREQKDFPTIEELQERMGADPEMTIQALQRLMKLGFLTIDEDIDPDTNIQYESYNLSGLYDKLGESVAEEARLRKQRRRQEAVPQAAALQTESETESANLFTIFEQEFGRPLSPMECETIAGWIDKDRYPEPLILLALKEAVFAGKVHFRYIDRILLEWMRNRVRTVEEAKAYTQKFRSGGRT
ncbi:DnaD domain-containing protein [Paenibacillus sp. CECT 9249]|uniref:DnaD domain-containing protein n=1 Tax=unclassified Paenibacillus TaxID=185978 RepID=UPI001C11D651|nr:DnaD domain-containing protein [Paenibacillus sp. CECT 9249]MBU5444018.1 DnaD domain-containing protein [Paenibacillus sp. MSJ-34]CAH0118799.1 DNA replication protein DnaD [Paenibacillus sp. CECT 9249]